MNLSINWFITLDHRIIPWQFDCFTDSSSGCLIDSLIESLRSVLQVKNSSAGRRMPFALVNEFVTSRTGKRTGKPRKTSADCKDARWMTSFWPSLPARTASKYSTALLRVFDLSLQLFVSFRWVSDSTTTKSSIMLCGKDVGSHRWSALFAIWKKKWTKSTSSGFLSTRPGVASELFVFTPAVTADLQARSFLMNMTSVNGEFPCTTCETRGEVVPKRAGHCRIFLPGDDISLRSDATIRANGAAGTPDVPVFAGICLRWWLDESIAPLIDDWLMRFLCSLVGDGVLRQSTYLQSCWSYGFWFRGADWPNARRMSGSFQKTCHSSFYWCTAISYLSRDNYTSRLFLPLLVQPAWIMNFSYIISQRKTANARYRSFSPPPSFNRNPVEIDAAQWKASDFHNWVVHYSVPCLMGLLEAKYMQHWILLVDAYAVLSSGLIHEEDLLRAGAQLRRFCSLFPSLFGETLK